MSIRVFHADLNPSIDPFSYRLSNARAAELVMRDLGTFISTENGRQAVQLFRSRASVEDTWMERRCSCDTKADTGKLPPVEIPGVFFRPPEPQPFALNF